MQYAPGKQVYWMPFSTHPSPCAITADDGLIEDSTDGTYEGPTVRVVGFTEDGVH